MEKPPFVVDQNTWLLHSYPEFGKKWNDISKTDTYHIYIYICKKNDRQTLILLEGKWKKLKKKTSNVERPYFNGQMGIERSMMTIVAKSPGIFWIQAAFTGWSFFATNMEMWPTWEFNSKNLTGVYDLPSKQLILYIFIHKKYQTGIYMWNIGETTKPGNVVKPPSTWTG